MSQRGRPGPGNSPGGRDPRRSRDGAGTRGPSRTRPAEPAAPDPDRRNTAGGGTPAPAAPREKSAGSRRTPRRVGAAATSDRTFLGLSTARAVVLAMVVCALALTLAVPLRNYLSQRNETEQVAEQRAQLEADVARLTREKQQANDPAYVRAQAGDRLQFVMPGETPYQVQLPGATAPPVEDLTKPKHDNDPWYTNLWRPIAEPQPTPTAAPPTAAPPPQPPAPQPAPAGSMTIPHDQGGTPG